MKPNADLPSEWIFIATNKCIQQCSLKTEGPELDSLSIITLQHPCTKQPTKFLLQSDTNALYEINAHKDKCCSWFIDSSVQQDGSLYVITPFDPLFILLPYLRENVETGKFLLLDQMLKDCEFPDCAKLVKCLTATALVNITDSSGEGDLIGYKYNDEKTLRWLKIKVERTVEAIKATGFFVPRGDHGDEDDREVIEYAFGIVTSYTDLSVTCRLRTHMNIRSKPQKRHSIGTDNHSQSKRIKNENNISGKKTPKMTRAQRELSKVNKKGMKSISSFFSSSSKK